MYPWLTAGVSLSMALDTPSAAPVELTEVGYFPAARSFVSPSCGRSTNNSYQNWQ